MLASPLRRQMLHPTLLSLAWHAEDIGASCVSARKDGHSCGTSLGFDHAFVYGCAQGGVGRPPLSARAFRFSEDQSLRGQLETLQQAGRDSHCWPLLNWRRRPCSSAECCEGLGVLRRLDERGRPSWLVLARTSAPTLRGKSWRKSSSRQLKAKAGRPAKKDCIRSFAAGICSATRASKSLKPAAGVVSGKRRPMAGTGDFPCGCCWNGRLPSKVAPGEGKGSALIISESAESWVRLPATLSADTSALSNLV